MEVGGGASLEDVVERIPAATDGEYDIVDWVSSGTWNYCAGNRSGYTTYARLVCVPPGSPPDELDAVTSTLKRAAGAFGGSCCCYSVGDTRDTTRHTPKMTIADMLSTCKRFLSQL